MRLLAIDPGVKALGWAWFRDNHLTRCGLLRAMDVQEMVDKLRTLDFSPCTPRVVVVERPQVYVEAKADPNDLIGLSLVAGAAAAMFRFDELDLPRPAKWKGQVPKEIHHRRIVEELTSVECSALDSNRFPKSLQHNVLDAVGLGLWKLGRLTR